MLRREAEIPATSCHGGKSPKMSANSVRKRRTLLREPRTHDVTALLLDWRGGNASAVEKLMPLVHGELRRIARRHMAGERPDHLLQATALVNEVYLRLVDVRRVQWQDRAHFFAVAARLMRRVLVDFARAQKNQKRGGALHRVTLDQNLPVASDTPVDLIAIDEALHALSEAYERKAQVVELRFFGGLSVEETAEVLHISQETVMRDWKFAKNWLLRELSRGARPGSDTPRR
jgi:RNA polymerase sigma factor (TIGR02999 family)